MRLREPGELERDCKIAWEVARAALDQ